MEGETSPTRLQLPTETVFSKANVVIDFQFTNQVNEAITSFELEKKKPEDFKEFRIGQIVYEKVHVDAIHPQRKSYPEVALAEGQILRHTVQPEMVKYYQQEYELKLRQYQLAVHQKALEIDNEGNHFLWPKDSQELYRLLIGDTKRLCKEIDALGAYQHKQAEKDFGRAALATFLFNKIRNQ